MSLLNMWREARGAVMRKKYLDTMARMRNANKYALRGFHNNISQIADNWREFYAAASDSDRKAFLKQCRKDAAHMGVTVRYGDSAFNSNYGDRHFFTVILASATPYPWGLR